MENEKIIEKLISKTDVTYAEAVGVLEKCNWNILDAVLELENEGRINKPSISIYKTNEKNDKIKKNEIVKVEIKKEKRKNVFQSFIEIICSLIDRGNNIFLEISRYKKVIIKLPVNVILLLLFFAFWGIVPIFIISFLFSFEYRFIGRGVEDNVINKVLARLSEEVQKRKRRSRRK